VQHLDPDSVVEHVGPGSVVECPDPWKIVGRRGPGPARSKSKVVDQLGPRGIVERNSGVV
jgi:hypothetical protein